MSNNNLNKNLKFGRIKNIQVKFKDNQILDLIKLLYWTWIDKNEINKQVRKLIDLLNFFLKFYLIF